MLVRVCNKCGKHLNGRGYNRFCGKMFNANGAMRKETEYDLCEECTTLLEEFFKMDEDGDTH